MRELILNAWIGWNSFKEPGKLVGLLLVFVVFLCIYRQRESIRTLTLYTTIMTVLCIMPVTAAVLMLYQTRFYDYQWVWSMVPMTILIATGLTVLVTDFYNEYRKKERKYVKGIIVAVPVILFFCGGMGIEPGLGDFRQSERKIAEQTLSQVKNMTGEQTVFLWAPKEILDYAREYDGGMELLYGRNMWDEALNAYTYDVYPEEITDMYQWLDGEEGRKISDEECAELAAASGVNCVILPLESSMETVACFSSVLGKEATPLEYYYVWVL